jgi:mannosyltransferase
LTVSKPTPSASRHGRSASDTTPDRRSLWLVCAVVTVLLAGVFLRFWTRSALWLDEAVSVNIARLPLGNLVDALRHDGSPPLYYLLLHFWARLFGTGNVAVRTLSGVLGLPTLVLAWFAGRRVGGNRVAWIALLVFASSPYAIRFATEARMFSLVMTLVLAGYLALRRVLEQPSRWRIVVLAVITTLLLYTHYWAFFLFVPVAAALIVIALRTRGTSQARPAHGALLALALGAAGFLPWLSVLSYQLQHTGTPWGNAFPPWYGLGTAYANFTGSFGGQYHGESFLLFPPLIVLPLFAVFGRALDRRRIEWDLRTRPAVRWEAAAGFGALVLGLCGAYLAGSAFQGRYAAMVFPLILLVVAFGFTVFADRAVQVAAVAIIVGLGLAGGVRNGLDQRTQAFQVAQVIRASSRRGDVVAYCPDQVGPDTTRLLDGVSGLRQLTFPTGGPPLGIDWVDYRDRMRRAKPETFVQRVLSATTHGHRIWLVYAYNYLGLEGKCEAIATLLGSQVPPQRMRVAPNGGRYAEAIGLLEYPGR